MTMVMTNSFCQARSNILFANYEPIMGICVKVFNNL